jgi:hypothetical protein
MPIAQNQEIKMLCTPDAVEFKDNGKHVYFKATDCPLVKHWKTKYDAQTKVEYILRGGTSLLFDSDESTKPLLPGSDHERGDTVWAVPSAEPGAYYEASLIRQLALATTAKEYEQCRLNLSKAGYPPDVLAAIESPK